MVLRSSEAELARWRDCISNAVEPNGQLIASLVPELELVIGKQPPMPDLSPQDSRNRFQMVFRSFLHVFARPHTRSCCFSTTCNGSTARHLL